MLHHNAKPFRSTSTVGMPVTQNQIRVQRHLDLIFLTGRTNDSRNALTSCFAYMIQHLVLVLFKTERAAYIEALQRRKRAAVRQPSFLESVYFTDSLRKLTAEIKQAGEPMSLKTRRAAPALRARILRSYVPLRCGPSESAVARDTGSPAYVLSI